MSHIGKPNLANEGMFWDGYKFADSLINNAKVDSVAAIAGTKVSPDFGSQNIITLGDGYLGHNLRFSYLTPTSGYNIIKPYDALAGQGSGSHIQLAAGNAAPDATNAEFGGTIAITAGNGGFAGYGGNIGIAAGDGFSIRPGGAVSIAGGANNDASGGGGNIYLYGGDASDGGTGPGGNVEIIGGSSGTVAGGNVTIHGGDGSTGGNLTLQGGYGNTLGSGTTFLIGANSDPDASIGNLVISGGKSSLTQFGQIYIGTYGPSALNASFINLDSKFEIDIGTGKTSTIYLGNAFDNTIGIHTVDVPLNTGIFQIGCAVTSFVAPGGDGDYTIQVDDETAGNVVGGGLTVKTGAGHGNQAGGILALAAGNGGTSSGAQGGPITITAGNSNSNTFGGSVTITAGNGGSDTGTGGSVNIIAGNGGTHRGTINIGTTFAYDVLVGTGASRFVTIGNSINTATTTTVQAVGGNLAINSNAVNINGTNTVSGSPGTITLQSGNDANIEGAGLYMYAGNNSDNTTYGGGVEIYAGDGRYGGSLTLRGGSATGTEGDPGAGGNAEIDGGKITGTGNSGDILIGASFAKNIDIGSSAVGIISIGNSSYGLLTISTSKFWLDAIGNPMHLKVASIDRIIIDTAITIQDGTLLTTTATGNINLPNNASARFQIDGYSVSSTVTAGALDVLTAGPISNADGYHTHAVQPGSFVKTFTYADLVAGVLTVNHGLVSQYPVVEIYDGYGQLIVPNSVTATSSIISTVDLSGFGAIYGTWHAVVVSSGTATGAFVKAFTNTDIIGNILTVNHNLNNEYNTVQVYRNDGYAMLPDNIKALTTNTLEIHLQSAVPITGTWFAVIGGALGSTGGGGISAIVNVDTGHAPYTVSSSDRYISIDPTGGVLSINLPASPGTVQQIMFKNRTTSTNAITINRAGSQTIDGATSITMNTSRASVTLTYNAGTTDWEIS